VINKPRDLVVHPGAGNPDGTVLNALLHYYPPIADDLAQLQRLHQPGLRWNGFRHHHQTGGVFIQTVDDKPRDLVVHPGAGNPDGTVLNALLHYYPPIADVPRYPAAGSAPLLRFPHR
jgi:23S rRNA-/tRNA-specific pseudouridylate synthase